jgi:uncharacterized protein YutE (UPF0331/DUF86 family)
MTPPGDELARKLAALASYADELDDWLANPPEPSRPRALERILERLIQVIVECAADAGDLWLAGHGHALGESVRGVFRRLREVGAVSIEIEDRFGNYGRTRNLIVHAYDQLDAREILAQARQLSTDARTLLGALVAS